MKIQTVEQKSHPFNLSTKLVKDLGRGGLPEGCDAGTVIHDGENHATTTLQCRRPGCQNDCSLACGEKVPLSRFNVR